MMTRRDPREATARRDGLALAPWLVLLALAGPAFGEAPPTKVEVFPPDVLLSTARDRQALVVQATYADGITRDVTKEATFTPADPAPIRREGSTLYPVADGATTLAVAFGGQSV